MKLSTIIGRRYSARRARLFSLPALEALESRLLLSAAAAVVDAATPFNMAEGDPASTDTAHFSLTGPGSVRVDYDNVTHQIYRLVFQNGCNTSTNLSVTVTTPTQPGDNFESGALNSSWTTYSSDGNGRIQVTNAYAASGNATNVLMMDRTVSDGGSSLNEAVWNVDLAGATKAEMNFSYANWYDNPNAFNGAFAGHYNADGIAISADGVNWYPVWTPPAPPASYQQWNGSEWVTAWQPVQWRNATIDLAAAAAQAGISPGSNFLIKFQDYIAGPSFTTPFDGTHTGGVAWDNISITTVHPGSSTEPNGYAEIGYIMADPSANIAGLGAISIQGNLTGDNFDEAALGLDAASANHPTVNLPYASLNITSYSPGGSSATPTSGFIFTAPGGSANAIDFTSPFLQGSWINAYGIVGNVNIGGAFTGSMSLETSGLLGTMTIAGDFGWYDTNGDGLAQNQYNPNDSNYSANGELGGSIYSEGGLYRLEIQGNLYNGNGIGTEINVGGNVDSFILHGGMEDGWTAVWPGLWGSIQYAPYYQNNTIQMNYNTAYTTAVHAANFRYVEIGSVNGVSIGNYCEIVAGTPYDQTSAALPNGYITQFVAHGSVAQSYNNQWQISQYYYGTNYSWTNFSIGSAAIPTIRPTPTNLETAPPTFALADPLNNAVIGINILNNRGYIDVNFPDTGSWQGSNTSVLSVIDSAPEFVLSGSAAEFVTVDGAATYEGGSTYRYYFTGNFKRGWITLTPIAGSFADNNGNLNVDVTLETFYVAPELTVSDAQVVEGNSGTTNLVFTLSLSNPTPDAVTVQYATADGAAMNQAFWFQTPTGTYTGVLSPADYTSTSGTATIIAGTTLTTVTVQVNGDTLAEANETILLNLSNAQHAVLVRSQAVGTIINDDQQPNAGVANARVLEGDSGLTPMTFAVTLAAPYGETASFDWTTKDGAGDTGAVAGVDYVAASGTLQILPGNKTATITVNVIGDTAIESNKTFYLELSNPVGVNLLRTEITGTIVDDDTPTIQISGAQIPEGDSGTTPMDFTVSLSKPFIYPVTVHYATADGTAIAGTDYAATSGDLIFNVGETSKTVSVLVMGNILYEADKTFTVALSSSSVPIATVVDDQGNMVSMGAATGTILNDDPAPVISIKCDVLNPGDTDYANSVTEGNTGAQTTLTYTVSLSEASGQPISVTAETVGKGDDDAIVYFSSARPTATPLADYIPNQETLTFQPGETTKMFTVTVLGDNIYDGNEFFYVFLKAPTAGATTDYQYGYDQTTILDDDPKPYLRIDPTSTVISVAEGDSGTTVVPITATLVDPVTGLPTTSGAKVTFKYTVGSGTATKGTDYTAPGDNTITITIQPGDTTATFGTTVPTGVIAVVGDAAIESNETFVATLASVSGATLDGNNKTSTVTIVNDDPSLTISDVSRLELGSGQSPTYTFTVTLQTGGVAYNTPVTVHYATADPTNPPAGTMAARAGIDYTAVSGDLTFSPGQTTKTITVTEYGNNIWEPDKIFYVNLSSASVRLAKSQGVGTIQNDDSVPSISISNPSVLEGNAGDSSVLTFTVTVTGQTGGPLSVDYATADGTARHTAGNFIGAVGAQIPGNPADYAPVSGTLTFAAGETSKTISVPIIGDNLYESGETVLLNLSNATSGATISKSQGTGTILNDDPLPTVSISDPQPVLEGVPGQQTPVTFTITISGQTSQPVMVRATAQDGTAVEGTDYIDGTRSSFLFNPGDTTKTYTYTAYVLGNLQVQSDRTFNVVLSQPVVGDYFYLYNADGTFWTWTTVAANDLNYTLPKSTGAGAIIDDDTVKVSIANAQVKEGNSGATELDFLVTLPTLTTDTVRVDYATADGTATAGQDYAAQSGTLEFGPLENTRLIKVIVYGDTTYEADETLFINLSNAVADRTNADFTHTITPIPIAISQAVGTILNDDPAPAISIGDAQVAEGDSGTLNMVFTVSLVQPNDVFPVTVDYATADGTATAGSDYVATAGTLTFNPGETTKTITVPVNGDTLYEADETFTVNLANITNATPATVTGAGTILNDDQPPSISIGDAQVNEGDAGTTDATITVTLSAPSGVTATVDYATVNGTAVSGVDYIAASGTLTFNPGETSKTITVEINGNTVYQPDRFFTVKLDNASNATFANGDSAVTIIDDDTPVEASINDIQLKEGDTGTTPAIFTVTLASPSVKTVTIDYMTAPGTATANVGYVTTTGTITFNPGETSKTITVPVIGNTVPQPDRTFYVNLTGGNFVTFTKDQGRGTILDDDTVPTISISDAQVPEGNSGTTPMVFTLTLSEPAKQVGTVDYAATDGTAKSSDGDYVPAVGKITFDIGETTKTITVLVNGDTKYEPNETLYINFSNPVNLLLPDTQAVGAIINDDPEPALSVSDVKVAEGNSGATNAVFTVSLSSPTSQIVTVRYQTKDGTATAGSDYNAASGTLTFAPGTTTKAVTVAVNGDTMYEPDEAFYVLLDSAVNAGVTNGSATGAIGNDDPLPAISISDAQVTEGNSGTTNMVFTVSMSNPSSQPVTVQCATSDGTSVAGRDYTAANGTLTFNTGETSKTITILVNGDTIYEGNRALLVNLTNPVNGTMAKGQGVGTIIDDDQPPTLSIGNASVLEGDSGTRDMIFTVTLSQAVTVPVSVNYATADGTAKWSDGDYTSASGILTIAAYQTTGYITVKVIGDTALDGTQNFSINLSNPVNAVLSNSAGIGTILNDDWRTIAFNTTKAASYKDAASNTITASLTSAGSGEVRFMYATQCDAYDITVSGATASSVLTIASSSSSMMTTLQNVTVNSPIKSIAAKPVRLLGDATITGSVSSLQFNDVANDTITIGAPSGTNTTVTMTFDNVTDASINSGMPIATLTVTDWHDIGDAVDLIQTPWIGTITTKGDFEADLKVTSSNSGVGLSNATIGGNLDNSLWDITGNITKIAVTGTASHDTIRSSGNMGSVALGASVSSDFLAGMNSSVVRHATTHDDFVNTLATIKAFTINGLKTGLPNARFFADSNISAATIGTVSLKNLDRTTSAAEYGLYARNSGTATAISGKEITSLTVLETSANTTFTWKPVAGSRPGKMPLYMDPFVVRIL